MPVVVNYLQGEKNILTWLCDGIEISEHGLGLAQHAPLVAFGDLLKPLQKPVESLWSIAVESW